MRASEALHQIKFGDSWQDSAYSTDNYPHSMDIHLGIAPPEYFVLKLRLHKISAWTMLLSCYKANSLNLIRSIQIYSLNVFVDKKSIDNMNK